MDIKQKYQLAYQKILSAKRILLVGHISPDGDDLASLCLLGRLSASLGLSRVLYCEGARSPEFSFLPGVDEIIDSKNKLLDFLSAKDDDDWLDEFDLLITSDCGSIERTNLAAEIRGRKKTFVIEFDHHQKVSDYSDLEIRQADKSSTAELLYHFLDANHLSFDRESATCVLTGIMTDTGNFLYPSASADTLAVASRMLALGVNVNRIMGAVLQNKKVATLKLLSRALDNLKINDKQGIAVSVLRPEDFESCGHDFASEAFDDIVAVLANLADVKAVLLLREYESGKIKGSWRSKPGGLDVSILAKNLGGGGHKHAAGFQVSGHIVWENDFWRVR